MAQYNISLNLADSQVNEFNDFLRAKFGKKADGTDYTVAEVRALQRDAVREQIRAEFRAYKKTINQELDLT